MSSTGVLAGGNEVFSDNDQYTLSATTGFAFAAGGETQLSGTAAGINIANLQITQSPLNIQSGGTNSVAVINTSPNTLPGIVITNSSTTLDIGYTDSEATDYAFIGTVTQLVLMPLRTEVSTTSIHDYNFFNYSTATVTVKDNTNTTTLATIPSLYYTGVSFIGQINIVSTVGGLAELNNGTGILGVTGTHSIIVELPIPQSGSSWTIYNLNSVGAIIITYPAGTVVATLPIGYRQSFVANPGWIVGSQIAASSIPGVPTFNSPSKFTDVANPIVLDNTGFLLPLTYAGYDIHTNLTANACFTSLLDIVGNSISTPYTVTADTPQTIYFSSSLSAAFTINLPDYVSATHTVANELAINTGSTYTVINASSYAITLYSNSTYSYTVQAGATSLVTSLNQSLGNWAVNQLGFTSPLPIANGGTGLTTVGAANEVLTSNGTTLFYQNPLSGLMGISSTTGTILSLSLSGSTVVTSGGAYTTTLLNYSASTFGGYFFVNINGFVELESDGSSTVTFNSFSLPYANASNYPIPLNVTLYYTGVVVSYPFIVTTGSNTATALTANSTMAGSFTSAQPTLITYNFSYQSVS